MGQSTSQHVKRKFSYGEFSRHRAAVVFIDLVGYTTLMEQNEDATHAHWMAMRVEIFEPNIEFYQGEIVKSTGDGLLITFNDTPGALNFAFKTQTDLSLARERRYSDMHVRTTVNLVDLIRENDDVYGEGVNIAARLLEFADPGGTVITASVEEEARDFVEFHKVDLGFLKLRNIERRVRAYKVSRLDEPEPKAVRPRGHQPSIAILPMQTFGIEEKDSYLADSMVYEIVASLSSLQEVFVTSSTSTLLLSSDNLERTGIAHRLGVQYLLNGKILRVREDLHMLVELSDTDRNVVIWTNRFEFKLNDLFEIQKQVAEQVAYALLPHIRQAELLRFRRKSGEVTDAYGCLLTGMDYLYRLSDKDFTIAKSYFDRAIKIDPTFSEAYAMMAKWHILHVGENQSDDIRSESLKALELSKQALEFNSSNALALSIYGHTLAFMFAEYEQALESFEKALAVSPNSAVSWGLSAPTFCYIGKGEEAIARARHALALSPLERFAYFYRSTLTTAHYINGDFEEAVFWGRRTYGTAPNFIANLRGLIASLAAIGEIDEAKSFAEKFLLIDPNFRVGPFLEWYPIKNNHTKRLLAEHLSAAGLPR
ncbi:MAG: hypothetical protein GKS00_06520 [Alphaproteobacteria bacterium]|nr:hypothetical protein [Alphaproteobacteria bacterium]